MHPFGVFAPYYVPIKVTRHMVHLSLDKVKLPHLEDQQWYCSTTDEKIDSEGYSRHLSVRFTPSLHVYLCQASTKTELLR